MTNTEQRALREVVLNQLTTGESRAYKMWLPPLLDPLPVNELVERDAGKDGHAGPANGRTILVGRCLRLDADNTSRYGAWTRHLDFSALESSNQGRH